MKIWTCPKCKRRFRKETPLHSCNIYPVEKHLENRSDEIKDLYEELLKRIKKDVGNFYVESLPCCIHLVKNAYTFLAVFAMKDKVRIHLALDKSKDTKRSVASVPLSANQVKYRIEVTTKEEIDDELLNLIRESYNYKE